MQPTVNRFPGLTSIIPLSKLCASGGTKWGMWKAPRFTFSNKFRRLSSSKGRAPWKNVDHDCAYLHTTG